MASSVTRSARALYSCPVLLTHPSCGIPHVTSCRLYNKLFALLMKHATAAELRLSPSDGCACMGQARCKALNASSGSNPHEHRVKHQLRAAASTRCPRGTGRPYSTSQPTVCLWLGCWLVPAHAWCLRLVAWCIGRHCASHGNACRACLPASSSSADNLHGRVNTHHDAFKVGYHEAAQQAL